MTATTTNGKPQRKQLANQLDRLHGVIDSLADGLNEAVADACREDTRLAVKDAILEILTKPDLRALIVPMTAAPATTIPAPAPEPTKPSQWARLKVIIAAAREYRDVPAKVTATVTSPFRSAIKTVEALGQATGDALPWKRVVWVSATIGLAVGVVCLATPNWLSATIGAAGTSAATVAVQTGVWLKSAARRFGLLN